MKIKVTAPLKNFTGTVVGVDFKAGTAELETDNDAGRAAYAYFDRAGYRMEGVSDPEKEPGTPPPAPNGDDEPYDPAEHSVDEVLAHLDAVTYEEAARVLDAEAEGKNRVTITGKRDAVLADKTPAAPAEDDSKGPSA
jgi:hypothetical protein